MPTKIDRHELQRLVSEESGQIVEVLPEAEFAEAHLPGAVNVSLKDLDRETTGGLTKDEPVIVY